MTVTACRKPGADSRGRRKSSRRRYHKPGPCVRWPVFKGSMTIRKWERAWIFGGSYFAVKELILEIEHKPQFGQIRP